jgi:hypothetical protein
MEYILSHFENLKTQYAYHDYMQAEDVATDEMTVESRKHFREAINNAWKKLNDYYTLLDDSPVYTAALVLHPGHNWQYIEEKWGEARRTSWIRAAKTSVKQFFDQGWKDRSSRPPTPEVTSLGPTNPTPMRPLQDLSPFEQFLTPATYYNAADVRVDEYKEYTKLRPQRIDNILYWWRDRRQTLPNMAQMAFDLLSIPAMSAECERVFSQTKLLITTQRSRLTDDIVEAVECLKHWYMAKLFE